MTDRRNRHLPRATALAGGFAATLMIAAGCGSDSSESDSPEEVTGTTYESPTDIIDTLTAEVVPCEPQDPPSATAYSDRAQTCFYTASDGVDDQMTAATYTTAAQQSDAIPYLQDLNPGAAYVQGNGWTVRTSQDLADQVAEVLDGEVVPAP